jgi:hypothetical protein
MQDEDDLRAFAKVMDFMRALSILFVVINLYRFCYGAFREWGVTIGVVDKILAGFNRTAELFSSRLWTKLFTNSRNDQSTSISTQLESLIPASKISNLTQGMFVGAVADNIDEKIEQKIFHCEIVVDNEAVAAETKAYKKIPVITNFVDGDGVDRMKEMIAENYDRIRAETRQIVEDEIKRIEEDPAICHLLSKRE